MYGMGRFTSPVAQRSVTALPVAACEIILGFRNYSALTLSVRTQVDHLHRNPNRKGVIWARSVSALCRLPGRLFLTGLPFDNATLHCGLHPGSRLQAIVLQCVGTRWRRCGREFLPPHHHCRHSQMRHRAENAGESRRRHVQFSETVELCSERKSGRRHAR